MSVTDELLQKVASGQEVLLVEVKRLRDAHIQLSEEFQLHRRDDREDFNRVFQTIEANRKDRSEQFGNIYQSVVRRIDQQDTTMKELRKQIEAADKIVNRGAGAGWAILGVVGFIGSILVVVINHFWK